MCNGSVGNRICKKCGYLCKVANREGELVGFMCECDFSDVTIDWAVEEDLTECRNYYSSSKVVRFKYCLLMAWYYIISLIENCESKIVLRKKR